MSDLPIVPLSREDFFYLNKQDLKGRNFLFEWPDGSSQMVWVGHVNDFGDKRRINLSVVHSRGTSAKVGSTRTIISPTDLDQDLRIYPETE